MSEHRFDFIDLFAGIGGFHVALEQLGGRCVLASEIDSAAADVYGKAFPETRLVPDVTDITRPDIDSREAAAERIREVVPDHDVLCAGFPCQPFSKSGHQRGINETRGTLFFSILRILDARRPRFALLENVRNLAGPRQRDTWDVIIGHLQELGYRVCPEPVVFSPHLMPPGEGGAPQVRERVFILCEHVGEGQALDGPPLVENRPDPGWDPHEWHVADILDDDRDIPGLDRYRLRDDEHHWLSAWNAFVQRIDTDQLPGFPIWVDAFRPLAVTTGVPAWKADFLRKNSAFYLEHQATIDHWIDEFRVASFPASRRKLEWQARRAQPSAEDRNLFDLVMHFRPSGIRVKPPTYLPALVAITQTSIVGFRGQKAGRPWGRRITPREAARLQSLPDSHPLHDNDAKAYKQLGNAVNVGAVQRVARALFDSSEQGWPDRDQRGSLPR